MSKIPSPPLQLESLARCLGDCIFPVPEEVACSFFNILFDIFWAKYKFGLCIKTWRRGFGCLRLSFYLSRFFCYTIAYFVPFWVIENRVTKINFMYFNGNCDYSSCLGWSILFLYAPAHKALAFWASLSLRCHTVWKSLVSY